MFCVASCCSCVCLFDCLFGLFVFLLALFMLFVFFFLFISLAYFVLYMCVVELCSDNGVVGKDGRVWRGARLKMVNSVTLDPAS